MLKNIKINISGFCLLNRTQGSTDLTTALKNYDKEPSKGDGGIKVVPEFDLTKIKIGRLLVTQLCNYHKLEIKSANEWYKFNSDGEKFKDTHNSSDCYYDSYNITTGSTYNAFKQKTTIEFWDAPFIELCESWTEIIYEIEFETFFQIINDSNNEIIPVLSFNWFLNAHAEKTSNVWSMINESHSDSETINASIQLNNPPNGSDSLKQITEEVIQFRQRHKALQCKIK